MKFYLLFAILLSLSFANYSYTDKCYRFAGSKTGYMQYFYQYYINKKGIPLSEDFIVHQGGLKNPEPDVKYYYHHVLSDCKQTNSTFHCVSTTESIWFRISNTTHVDQFTKNCDPIFYKKYGDIMKHKCGGSGTSDPFYYLYQQLGTTTNLTLVMENNAPSRPSGTIPDGECIWEYEILGLWSIVAIVVVSCCVVAALLFITIIWIIAQKHRSNKRKRLESSLMHSTEMSSV